MSSTLPNQQYLTGCTRELFLWLRIDGTPDKPRVIYMLFDMHGLSENYFALSAIGLACIVIYASSPISAVPLEGLTKNPLDTASPPSMDGSSRSPAPSLSNLTLSPPRR